MHSERGMLVGVYRPANYDNSGYDDCTNGGESSRVSKFVVVGVMRRGSDEVEEMPRDSRVFSPSEKSPAAILTAGAFPGCPPKLVPLSALGKLDGKTMVGPMAGGNLADSSDGRWGELVRSMMKDDSVGNEVLLMVSAVDIHDRVETQDLYNTLSM